MYPYLSLLQCYQHYISRNVPIFISLAVLPTLCKKKCTYIYLSCSANNIMSVEMYPFLPLLQFYQHCVSTNVPIFISVAVLPTLCKQKCTYIYLSCSANNIMSVEMYPYLPFLQFYQHCVSTNVPIFISVAVLPTLFKQKCTYIYLSCSANNIMSVEMYPYLPFLQFYQHCVSTNVPIFISLAVLPTLCKQKCTHIYLSCSSTNIV